MNWAPMWTTDINSREVGARTRSGRPTASPLHRRPVGTTDETPAL